MVSWCNSNALPVVLENVTSAAVPPPTVGTTVKSIPEIYAASSSDNRSLM